MQHPGIRKRQSGVAQARNYYDKKKSFLQHGVELSSVEELVHRLRLTQDADNFKLLDTFRRKSSESRAAFSCICCSRTTRPVRVRDATRPDLYGSCSSGDVIIRPGYVLAPARVQ